MSVNGNIRHCSVLSSKTRMLQHPVHWMEIIPEIRIQTWIYDNCGMGKYDCQRFLPKAWRQQKAHSIISVPERESCRFICFRSPLLQDSFEIGRISYNLTIPCLQKSHREVNIHNARQMALSFLYSEKR